MQKRKRVALFCLMIIFAIIGIIICKVMDQQGSVDHMGNIPVQEVEMSGVDV